MIDMKEAEPGLFREICEDIDVRHCFTCGACVGGCPAAEANPPLLVRSLVRKVVLGLAEELLEDDTPWSCVTCSRCEEFCPMDVKPFEVGLAVRKWQCRNDPTRIPMATEEVYSRGYSQPVAQSAELRKSVGLTEAPSTIDKFPEQMKRFQEMLMSIELIKDNDFMYGSGDRS